MSPEELYAQSIEIMQECNPAGVTTDEAAVFVAQVKDRLQQVVSWLPPTYGSTGYADSQVLDHLRQIKYQSEATLRNFPMGFEAFSSALDQFCRYLSTNYHVESNLR